MGTQSVDILQTLSSLARESGLAQFLQNPLALVMVGIACVLIYLAIVKKFEPLLLLPIAFGMLLTNLLGSEVYHEQLFAGGHANWSLFGGAILVDSPNLANLKELLETGALTVNNAGAVLINGNVIGQITSSYSVGAQLDALGRLIAEDGVTVLAESTSIIIKDSAAFISDGQVYSAIGTLLATAGKTISPGLLDYLYLGVKLGIYPCLIFIGVGAGTDFGPLIANPKTLLLGAAAQLGIFMTFIGASLLGFNTAEAGAIGIIGGADGPTAIWLTGKLAPICWAPSPWPRTATWPWFPSFSPPS